MKHLIILALLLISTASVAGTFCPNLPGDTWNEIGINVLKQALLEERGIRVKSITFNRAKSKAYTLPGPSEANTRYVVFRNLRVLTTQGNSLVPQWSSIDNYVQSLIEVTDNDFVIELNRGKEKDHYDSEGALIQSNATVCEVKILTRIVNAATGSTIIHY